MYCLDSMSVQEKSKSKLRLLREATGLSRERVAAQLDPPMSSKTLERMEQGKAPLKGFRLKQLAVIYDVSPDDLGDAT